MRRVGTIPSQEASERFRNYLEHNEIPCQIDMTPDGWEVWIYDEEQVPSARERLQRFLDHPDDAEFRSSRRTRPKAAPRAPEAARPPHRRPELLPWEQPLYFQVPLTLLLIFGSLAVTFLTNFGRAHPEVVQAISIAPYRTLYTPVGTYLQFDNSLSAITRHGEVWRLFTPMFLHLSWLHLIFNMYATFHVAGIIESAQGTRRLLWVTLLVAPLSHLTQFFVPGGGPGFGGMSGVFYGWFGYLWARGHLDPESEIVVPPIVVNMLMAWLLICFTGLLGPVANWAHVGGLVAGLIVGGLPPLLRRFLLRYR